MSGVAFRGTTSEQDPRWGNSEKKLLDKLTKAGTFPPEYEVKIDVSKCKLPIINKWISERLIDLLGFEDDIVINLAVNLLTEPNLDARKVHMALVGFLEKKTQSFVQELWVLLADAQSNPTGVPSVFLEKKKSEMQQRSEEQSRGRREDERKSRWGEQGRSGEGTSSSRTGSNSGAGERERRRERSRDRDRERERDRDRRRGRSSSSSAEGRGEKRERKPRDRSRSHSGGRSRRRSSRSRSRERRGGRDRDRQGRRERSEERHGGHRREAGQRKRSTSRSSSGDRREVRHR